MSENVCACVCVRESSVCVDVSVGGCDRQD